MGSHDALKPVLIEKVHQLIETKFEGSQTALVLALARHLFSNISYDDLINRTESDLYGAVISLWHHINEVNASETSVRVFNPTISKQGWQSPHTIIEIVMPDSPFLVDSLRMLLQRREVTCHLMLHGPARMQRNEQNQVIAINAQEGALVSMFHIEIDHLSSGKAISELHAEITHILEDIAKVVHDWQPMVKQLNTVIKSIEAQKDELPLDWQHVEESIKFLHWVADQNFFFIG